MIVVCGCRTECVCWVCGCVGGVCVGVLVGGVDGLGQRGWIGKKGRNRRGGEGGGKVYSCGILGPLTRRGVAKPPVGTLPCPWYQWCDL